MDRLRVLVTNDDGIEAPGIRPLAVAAAEAGHEVVVAAPARQWSGASAAIVVDDDADQVTVDPRRMHGVHEAWAVHAAPAMCVLLALRATFGARPDLVLSGINYGANTGRVLLHSGTAGAALTAGVGGLRALAVSLDVEWSAGRLHWEDAAQTAAALLPVLVAQPASTVLNLNVPNQPGPHAFREAPLATGGVVHTTVDGAEDSVQADLARGGGADAGSDLDLLAQGYATVTAITPPAGVPVRGRLPGGRFPTLRAPSGARVDGSRPGSRSARIVGSARGGARRVLLVPAADIEAGIDVARALLAEQHPDLADRPLAVSAEGWDNVVLRLGDDLAVRLPRRRAAAELIRHEQRALPAIAARVPVAVPAPVRLGAPSARFPFAWSVVPWFTGRTVAAGDLRDDLDLADALAAFVAALHVPAAQAPVNPVRGGPLTSRDAAMAGRLPVLDDPGLAALWRDALEAPAYDGAPVWLHGDLHPANLIQRDGRLVAVVDFGDVTGGDPATDLAAGWLTFGPAARERFRAGTRPDDATWTRAAGWALCMAAAMVLDGTPVTAAIGRRALAELAAGR